MIEPFRRLVDYTVWKLTEAHTKGIDRKDYARTRDGSIILIGLLGEGIGY